MGFERQRSEKRCGHCAASGLRIARRGLAFAEILRRAYPDRAKERLGLEEELKTREAFKAWYDGMMDAAWAKFIAAKNKG